MYAYVIKSLHFAPSTRVKGRGYLQEMDKWCIIRVLSKHVNNRERKATPRLACFDRRCSIDGGGLLFCGVRMQHRDRTYSKHFQKLVEIYGSMCFYCGDEVAMTIDHVIPVSWRSISDIENLRPSCVLCNVIAGNKMFDGIEHKKQYINERRKRYRNRRCVCTDCLMPYAYREHSPSLMLCPECYDTEYDTSHSRKASWIEFLGMMEIAGMFPEAHRKYRKYKLTGVTRSNVLYLSGLYSNEIDKQSLRCAG